MPTRTAPAQRIAQVTRAYEALLHRGDDDGAGAALLAPEAPAGGINDAALWAGPARQPCRMDVGIAELA